MLTVAVGSVPLSRPDWHPRKLPHRQRTGPDHGAGDDRVFMVALVVSQVRDMRMRRLMRGRSRRPLHLQKTFRNRLDIRRIRLGAGGCQHGVDLAAMVGLVVEELY